VDLYEEFTALIAALEAGKLGYAICGGMAMAIHGLPRATIDIDLLVPAGDLEPVLSTARQLGYTLPADPMSLAGGAVQIRRVSKVDAVAHDLLSLDLLVVTPAIEPAWNDRVRVRWDGGELWSVSRLGLIRLKQLRGSGQDRDDIGRLEKE
jgi:hypothetical protein